MRRTLGIVFTGGKLELGIYSTSPGWIPDVLPNVNQYVRILDVKTHRSKFSPHGKLHNILGINVKVIGYPALKPYQGIH